MKQRHLFAAAAFACGLPMGVPALGVDPAGPVQTEARDPWVPPELRGAKLAPATAGAALQAQVERKLRSTFEAADVRKTGALTRAEAQAAGFGVVAKNFDRIDVARTGRVTFEDLKRYLRARGARF